MKKLALILVILVLLAGGAFFARDYIFPGGGDEELTIVMNTAATDISPYALNLNNLTRIGNIYEGLVAFDRNLRVVPALAVSWGNISDTVWEFRLRQGVLFHDGSVFTAQDVVDTFEKAKASGNTQIESYISGIKEIVIKENDRIEVHTLAPDPLLLSKLTKLLITKENAVGTGPYELDEWKQGDRFALKAFKDYWGQEPEFQKVVYRVIESKIQRQNRFESGEIDLLVAVPEDQAQALSEKQIRTGFGLEVVFLMFKLDDPVFSERENREAIQSLIDPDRVVAIGNHFVRPSNQFIAPGVFGYNQSIEAPEYDPAKEARDLFGNRLERVNFDYLSSFRTLSEYISSQLRKAGFSVRLEPLEPDKLLEKIRENESQLFLIGWRAEDGDAGSFFESFVHSDGPMNGGRYSNPELDALIEESRSEMEPQARLALLQKTSALVVDELIGIPLFETSRLYAVQEYLDWEPRLDGMVLASEIKSN